MKRLGPALALGLLLLGLILAVFQYTRRGPPLVPVEAPPPLSSTPDRVRFVAIGDTGKGNAGQRKVAAAIDEVCAQRGCDFLVILGDALYPNGMDGPDDPRMAEVTTDLYDLPTYLVLGNHDYGRLHQPRRAARMVDWANQRSDVHLPARTYTFRAGPVAFWVVDTDEAFWNGHRPQSNWLSATMPESDASFKVVLGHHPFRSRGRHGNAGTYDGVPGWVPVASGRGLEPLFSGPVCDHADMYLSGHDHTLQWLEWCETTLLVSGAGASTTELESEVPSTRFQAAALGFIWLDGSAEMLKFSFFDEDGEELRRGTRTPRQD